MAPAMENHQGHEASVYAGVAEVANAKSRRGYRAPGASAGRCEGPSRESPGAPSPTDASVVIPTATRRVPSIPRKNGSTSWDAAPDPGGSRDAG